MNKSIGTGSSLGSKLITSDSTLATVYTCGRLANSTRGIGTDLACTSEAKLAAHPDDVAAFQALLSDPIAAQPMTANALTTPPAGGESADVASASSTALPISGAAVAPQVSSTYEVITGSQPVGASSVGVVTAGTHTDPAQQQFASWHAPLDKLPPSETTVQQGASTAEPSTIIGAVSDALVPETFGSTEHDIAADIARTKVTPLSDNSAAVTPPKGYATQVASTGSQHASAPSGVMSTADRRTALVAITRQKNSSGEAPQRNSASAVPEGIPAIDSYVHQNIAETIPMPESVVSTAEQHGIALQEPAVLQEYNSSANKKIASTAEPSIFLGTVSDAFVPETLVPTDRDIAAHIESTVAPPSFYDGAAVALPQGSPIHEVNSEINMISCQSETENRLRVDPGVFASVIKDVIRTLARRDLEALDSGREITLRLDNKLLPSTTLVLRSESDKSADVSESVTPQIRVTLKTESPEVAMFLRSHSATLTETLNRELPEKIRGNTGDPDFAPLSLEIVLKEMQTERSGSIPDGATDESGAKHRDSSGEDQPSEQQNRNGQATAGEQSTITSDSRPRADEDALAQNKHDEFRTLIDS